MEPLKFIKRCSIFILEFEPANDFAFYQNWYLFNGIPAEIKFTIVEYDRGGIWLEAPGFGQKGNEGEGLIYIKYKELPVNLLVGILNEVVAKNIIEDK